MPSVPLITSLPPGMKRYERNGDEVGAEYRASCTASWKTAGFSPIISVNSRKEIDENPELLGLAKGLGVEIVPVDRDASSITGKPHVYLADLLRIGCDSTPSGPYVLVNADIHLGRVTEISGALSALAQNRQFLLARRTNIIELTQREGELYNLGFDLFVVHASQAKVFPDLGLVLGAPWWDYYFPIILFLLSDAQPIELVGPLAFHLDHEERWSIQAYRDLGHRLLGDTLSLLEKEPFASKALAKEYAYGLHSAVQRRSGRVVSDLAYRLRKQLPVYARREPDKLLTRIALNNVMFLGRHAKVMEVNKGVYSHWGERNCDEPG